MTVQELLLSRTPDDISKIAQYLKMVRAEYYKNDTLEDIEAYFVFFLNECKKCHAVKPSTELSDFLIAVNECKETMPDEIKFLDEEHTKVDIDAIPTYFSVDGIHVSELLEKEDTFNYSLKEAREKKIESFTTYGIDFMERGDILNCEIVDLCLEKYNINVLAAEIFEEMTFYGLENSETSQEIFDVKSTCEDRISEIELHKDDEEWCEKHLIKLDVDDLYDEFGIEKPTKEYWDSHDQIFEYSVQKTNEFWKEYLEKYRNTQINRIMQAKTLSDAISKLDPLKNFLEQNNEER